MEIVYIGPKKVLNVQFPIPLISLAEMDTDHNYNFPKNKAVDVPDEQANQILEKMPGLFRKHEKPAKEETAKRTGNK